MWKVTAFLSRIEKLPPAVQDYWKKSTGVAPPAVDPQGEQHEPSRLEIGGSPGFPADIYNVGLRT